MDRVNLIIKIKTIGYLWEIIGLVIIGLSNLILISGHNETYLFLPINVRNNALTALLLLFPGAIIMTSHILLRKWGSK